MMNNGGTQTVVGNSPAASTAKGAIGKGTNAGSKIGLLLALLAGNRKGTKAFGGVLSGLVKSPTGKGKQDAHRLAGAAKQMLKGDVPVGTILSKAMQSGKESLATSIGADLSQPVVEGTPGDSEGTDQQGLLAVAQNTATSEGPASASVNASLLHGSEVGQSASTTGVQQAAQAVAQGTTVQSVITGQQNEVIVSGAPSGNGSPQQAVAQPTTVQSVMPGQQNEAVIRDMQTSNEPPQQTVPQGKAVQAAIPRQQNEAVINGAQASSGTPLQTVVQGKAVQSVMPGQQSAQGISTNTLREMGMVDAQGAPLQDETVVIPRGIAQRNETVSVNNQQGTGNPAGSNSQVGKQAAASVAKQSIGVTNPSQNVNTQTARAVATNPTQVPSTNAVAVDRPISEMVLPPTANDGILNRAGAAQPQVVEVSNPLSGNVVNPGNPQIPQTQVQQPQGPQQATSAPVTPAVQRPVVQPEVATPANNAPNAEQPTAPVGSTAFRVMQQALQQPGTIVSTVQSGLQPAGTPTETLAGTEVLYEQTVEVGQKAAANTGIPGMMVERKFEPGLIVAQRPDLPSKQANPKQKRSKSTKSARVGSMRNPVIDVDRQSSALTRTEGILRPGQAPANSLTKDGNVLANGFILKPEGEELAKQIKNEVNGLVGGKGQDVPVSFSLNQPTATAASLDGRFSLTQLVRMTAQEFNKFVVADQKTRTFNFESGQLGNVKIKFSQDATGTALQIIVETPEAAQMLQRAFPNLNVELDQQGLNFASVNVEVDGSGNEDELQGSDEENRTSNANASGAEEAPQELVAEQSRNFGYNTIELVA